MAFIYDKATLTPSKIELLNAWLPGQPWFTSDAPATKLDAYRFDDPDGEVGMEAFLLQAGDAVYHVPVTYRGAPLDDAEGHLVGTTEHSELGTRWVYNGVGDPVWVTAAATAVLTGGTQAVLYVEVDGELQPSGSGATVAGTGSPDTLVPPLTGLTLREEGTITVAGAGHYELSVVRRIGTPMTGTHSLSARWKDGGEGVLMTISATRPIG